MTLPDDAFAGPTTQWLAVLPAYQRRVVEQLLAGGRTPEQAIDLWLSASGAKDTVKFGGGPSASLVRDKFMEQLHQLLCGGEAFADERSEIAKLVGSREAMVAYLTTGLAAHLGTSEAWIAPIVVLAVIATGKMGLRAWCAAFTESARSNGTGLTGAG